VFVKHQLITPRNVDLIYPLDGKINAPVKLKASAVRAAAVA
jgi:hypothetical protein